VSFLFPFTSPIYTNNSCFVNESVSLLSRHLRNNEGNNTILIPLASASYDMFREKFPTQTLRKWSYDEVIQHKPKNRRRRYAAAKDSLVEHPTLTYRDTRVKMFVKNERMSDPDKAPRGIQARSTRYNMKLQQYLGPVERYLFHRSLNTTFVSKGMDQKQKGRLLYQATLDFKDPIYVLTDHRFYDSRQCTAYLKNEHAYYREFYPGDEELELLLEHQLKNHGVSPHGVRYSVTGTRMSGDVNTSLGNSCTNMAILTHWLGSLHSRVIVDGDDSVIIVEREDEQHLDFPALQRYGFLTKANIAYEFEHIEYCQCHPVNLADGWCLVRTPKRVIERSFTCIDPQYAKSDDLAKRWYHTVGICESSANAGVPVLEAAARALCRAHTRTVALNDTNIEYRTIKRDPIAITNGARVSFARAFGISPTKQALLEEYFDDFVWPDHAEDVLTSSLYLHVPRADLM